MIGLLSACNTVDKEVPKAENGVIDLSKWNFEQQGFVPLSGTWEFYWQKLLTPADFANDKLPAAEYIYVPQGWTVGRHGSKKYAEFGYATYRLKIKVPAHDLLYKFDFKANILTNVKIWINGKACLQVGEVAASSEKTKPTYIVDNLLWKQQYPLQTSEIELVIQIADFKMGGSYPGLKKDIFIGTSRQIQHKDTYTLVRNSLLIGILLAIALYHLVLFYYRPNEFSSLVFTFLAFFAMLRSVFTARFLQRHLQDFDLAIKLGHIPVAIYPALMAFFFYLLFRKETHKTLVYIFTGVSTFFLFLTLFLGTPNFFSHFAPYFMVLIILVFLYFLFYTLPLAIYRKRQGAVWAFLGLLVLLLANIYDFMVAFGTIQGTGFYLSDAGFVVYLVFQSFNIAERFSKSFKRNVKLNEELDFQNKNLEKIVGERTQVITERNEELKLQKEEIQAIADSLEMANSEITIQRDKIKDIYKNTADSINYASRIQTAMLPSTPELDALLTNYFVLYKPRDVVSGDFYWAKKVSGHVIVAVGDCTGHGVPGAFVSMLGISFLNEIVERNHITKTSEVLDELRTQVKRSLNQTNWFVEQKDGMDMAICAIETEKMRLQFAGANNSVYIVRNRRIIQLKGDRQPIGVHLREKPFINYEFSLKKGDLIYLLTDGYLDQLDNSNEVKFMIHRFKDLVIRTQDVPMREQKQIFEDEFNRWKGNNSQIDDVLLMGIRV